jgi:predicted  nucleic acid-binding Zn-ribbon protein
MDWGNAAQIASALLALSALVIAMSNRRTEETRKALSEVNGRVKDVDQGVDLLKQRMHTVEEHLRHLPDADTTHRLEKTMIELQGQLSVMGERLKPVAAIGDRLQDFLLNQATRKP